MLKPLTANGDLGTNVDEREGGKNVDFPEIEYLLVLVRLITFQIRAQIPGLGLDDYT